MTTSLLLTRADRYDAKHREAVTKGRWWAAPLYRSIRDGFRAVAKAFPAVVVVMALGIGVGCADPKARGAVEMVQATLAQQKPRLDPKFVAVAEAALTAARKDGSPKAVRKAFKTVEAAILQKVPLGPTDDGYLWVLAAVYSAEEGIR